MKKNMFLFVLAGCIATATTFQAVAFVEKNSTIHRADMPSHDEARKLRVGIMKSDWNPGIINPMFDDCVDELLALGVKETNIVVATVPGALELSFAASQLIGANLCDVCICLGAIIEGPHQLWAQALAHAVVQNLSTLSISSGVPIICGVLICTKADAETLVKHGIGGDWAQSALMMSLAVGF